MFYPTRVLIVLVLASHTVACAAATSTAASDRWNAWRKAQTRYPIATWAFFSRYQGTKEEYRTYAEANMTCVSVPFEQYENAVDSGLNVFLGPWEKLETNTEILKERIARSNASKGKVIGYQLRDEPEPNSFDSLGRTVRTIYEQDKTTAIPIIDLLPNWAWQRSYHRQIGYGLTYAEFVEAYVRAVSPAALLSCHYPPLADGSDRPEYYANFETLRDSALRNNIGLMGFVLCTELTNVHRRPSDSDLRWQVYSALAYGAQSIWYWNWRLQPEQKRGFTEGLVTHETGEPMPEYHLVKAINAEVLAIGGTLMKLKSRSVFHTADSVPPGGRRFPDEGISGASAIERLAGQNFLIGEFRNADDPADDDAYFLIVNKRHGMGKRSDDPTLQATALFKPCPPYTHVYVHDQTKGNLSALKSITHDGKPGYYSISLGGGQGVLLRLARVPRQ